MALLSKLSGGLGTAFADNVFLRARLKLTAVYVLALFFILSAFSALFYLDVRYDIQSRADSVTTSTEPLHGTLEDVRNGLLLANGIILIIAAIISFTFAGYTLRPIQRSIDVQRMFAENASHELRTPLAVMRNDIEVLLRDPDPSRDLVRTTLKSTLEEIDAMTQMTRDLLTLARSAREPSAIEKVNMLQITQKVVEKINFAAQKKGVALVAAGDSSLYVRGNTSDLERVVINILQNAIVHTHAGGRVSLSITQDKTDVVISVTDTGSGIDSKDLPYVFERFYKGENSQGTGLGLSIVKDLVNRHKGTIAIESKRGKGTTVVIKLPLFS